MVKGLKDKNKTKKNSEEEEKGKKKKTWENAYYLPLIKKIASALRSYH